MIWLKGLLLLIGIILFVRSLKFLLAIAKEKTETKEQKKFSLTSCSKCRTHVSNEQIKFVDGEPCCSECYKNNQ